MNDASLDDFMAWNEQLAALTAAGCSIDLGLGETPEAVAQRLGEINASVARQASRGATVSQAVEDSPDLPLAYRGAVQLGLTSGDLSAGLASAARVSVTEDDSRQPLRLALLYPLTVCLLALGGTCLLARLLVPRLADAYDSMQVPTGQGLAFWKFIEAALPYALPTAAGAVALVATARLVFGPSPWRRFLRRLGHGPAAHWQACGEFSASLAGLLRQGIGLEAALPAAARMTGEPSLAAAADRMAQAFGSGRSPDASAAEAAIPPLVRRIVLQDLGQVDRPAALDLAAEFCRSKSRRILQRRRMFLPMAACVLIAGTATLLYGVALFLPVVDLLMAIARQ